MAKLWRVDTEDGRYYQRTRAMARDLAASYRADKLARYGRTLKKHAVRVVRDT